MLSALLLSPAAPAEEPVKAMEFFREPLTLHAVAGKQRYLLVVLPQPGISLPVYALKGMIRYEGVEADAYLQMNNDFGEKGIYFTKSLAAAGPLAKISGSSDWRPFVLPFYANQGDHFDGVPLIPVEVTLALHLPGAGSVSIRDVELFQYTSDEDPLASAGQRPDRPGTARTATPILLLGALFVVALAVLVRRRRRT